VPQLRAGWRAAGVRRSSSGVCMRTLAISGFWAASYGFERCHGFVCHRAGRSKRQIMTATGRSHGASGEPRDSTRSSSGLSTGPSRTIITRSCVT